MGEEFSKFKAQYIANDSEQLPVLVTESWNIFLLPGYKTLGTSLWILMFQSIGTYLTGL